MTVPAAPPAYDRANENAFRDFVVKTFAKMFRKGQDVEIGAARLVLTDTVTGERYSVTVASGVVALVGPL